MIYLQDGVSRGATMRQEFVSEGWGGHSEAARPELSIIVPVYNGASTLAACLTALIEAPGPSREIIVADDASRDRSAAIAEAMGARCVKGEANRGAAAARNLGASQARAENLVFVDSDVVVHADALTQIAQFFATHPEHSAVFGSYDAEPAAKGFVSQYRNLLHHFTHQNGMAEAETFWTGLGAIRRSAFEQVDGFNESCRYVEDIELGLRMSSEGRRIALEAGLQCKHLKAWSLLEMAKMDIWYRALPWSSMLLARRRLTSDLNTSNACRLGVASAFLIALSLLLAWFSPSFLGVTAAAATSMLISMRPLLRFLREERGLAFAARSVPVHLVHLLCACAGFSVALLRHAGESLIVVGRGYAPATGLGTKRSLVQATDSPYS